MKTILNVPLMIALLAAAVPRSAMSTVFFTDDFANGSTTNQLSLPGGTATASFTSYDLGSSKNMNTSTIQANLLSLHLSGGTTSGFWEAQALFTTDPVVLTVPGDNVALAVVFTNSQGTLLPGTHSPIWIGLYNSGSGPSATNFPPSGGVLESNGFSNSAGSAFATGNCAQWQGYAAQNYDGVASTITTRPIQSGIGTTSANQELLGDEISSSAYSNPKGTTLVTGPVQTYTVATTGAYTEYLIITLDPAGSGNLIVSNALFVGAGTGGTMIFSNAVTVTSTNILATAFDGFAIGAFDHESAMLNPQMDISSITVSGQSTPPNGPPTITTEPVSVNVATGGSCAFFVAARGENVTYQWHRNGTNLLDGGDISGVNSSTLVISPAGAGDVFSGANGYYVTVTGAGDFSTNSTTNSLGLISAASLTWSGTSSIWDIATTAAWVGNQVFNDGDAVTFDNTGAGGQVNLSGAYIAPSSITVDEENGQTYTFQGSGSIAGPCALNYTGPGQLTLNCSNSYTGGTLIQNSLAYVYLEVYSGLGNGPVTLAQAGGEMEIIPSGNTGVGINGNIIVNDDFDIILDASGNYGGVFLGDLSGVSGKTLSIDLNATNTSATRVRAYGINTTYNAQLNLDNPNILFATYETSGSQTYNGVISGTGSLMQKASGTAITTLNGQNTYSGGTYIPQGVLALGCSSVGSITSGPIGTGPLYIAPDSTTTLTGNGQIMASGGPQSIANPLQYPTGTNNLTLVVGGNNALTLSGAYTLNGNDGMTSASFTSRNIQVTNTALTTITGVISDGGKAYGLNVAGPGGILSLDAPETYTGPTTVSNGTLQVDGSLASASAVTVATNGVLAGIGTVGGSVTVQAGGSVAPGDSGIGTLTVSGTLTMQTGSSNIIQINGNTAAHDSVTATSIAFNGTLFATNISATVPIVGTTYAIYTGSKSGNFSAVTGTPGAGRAWSFNASTGVLSVVNGVSTTPITFSYLVSGTTLTISWPSDHIGWQLQSTTTLASPSWTEVAGTTTVDSINITMSPTGNVYYRLAYIP